MVVVSAPSPTAMFLSPLVTPAKVSVPIAILLDAPAFTVFKESVPIPMLDSPDKAAFVGISPI